MPTFTGFTGTNATDVNKAYKAARQGLEALVKDIAENGTKVGSKFDTQFKKYMGDPGKTVAGNKETRDAIDVLVDTCKAMNAKIASVTFKVVYNSALSSNAEMLSFSSMFNNASLNSGAIQDLVDNYAYGTAKSGAMPMTIGPGFFTNPAYALDAQCHVESFLHELSHHAAGTIDDTNGGECYGLAGVNRLKGLGPARAVRNAENVGFFCMAWVNRIT
jgi:hypothetical protein